MNIWVVGTPNQLLLYWSKILKEHFFYKQGKADIGKKWSKC